MDKKRPNIIIFFTDHLRADQVGCYGNKSAITPAIDKLAEEGVIFKNCFSQNPICIPSRSSILTGKYPHNIGVYTNDYCINKEEICLPAILREYGYNTAVIGKLHLYEEKVHRFNADDGFNYRCILEGKSNIYTHGKPSYPYLDFLKRENCPLPSWSKIGNFFENLGCVISPYDEEHYVEGFIAEEAIKFLKESSSPFFLWIGFCSPHHPYDPPESCLQLYKNVEIPTPVYSPEEIRGKPSFFRAFQKDRLDRCKLPYKWEKEEIERILNIKRYYLATVTAVDRQIKKILHYLEETSNLDPTIIIFMSDHGDFLGDHGVIFKGAFLYDCMIHVPLIISSKLLKNKGIIIEEMVENIDIFSTILEFAEIPFSQKIYSKSLVPVMEGKKKEREYVFSEVLGSKMVRSLQWKLIHHSHTGESELYNLKEDPYELENLSEKKEYSAEKEKLINVLLDFLYTTDGTPKQKYKKKESTDPLTGKETTYYPIQ